MKAEVVINQLYNVYREKKFSHAYLIETNNINACLLDVKKLIKMTFCHEEYSDNCNKCNLCELLDKNYLPSVIIIEPEGKTINKDKIDDLKEKFSYSPIYTKNNYYVIVEAEKMNDTAYNKLLKFLEEPEDNIIGFYICNNIQKMPPTILSRLELVKLYYDEESSYNSEIVEIAKEYLNIVTNKNSDGIWYNNNTLAKRLTDRVEYIELFKYMLKYKQEAKDYQFSNIIKKYLDKLEYNVNIPLLLDSFVLEVGDKYGL